MKRRSDDEGAGSSNLTFDQATLAKRSKELNISYRTSQRWARRGAFDIEKLLEGLDNESSSLPDPCKNTEETSVPGSASDCVSLDVTSASSSSDETSSDSDERSSDSEGSCSGGFEDFSEQVNSGFNLDSDDLETVFLWDVNTQRGFTKLHSYTNKTVEEAVFSFMSSYLKHNKSRSCLEDDLKVLHSVLPTPNQMPKSVYLLLQFVEGYAPPCPITEMYCCEACQFYFGASHRDECPACKNTSSITFFIMSIEKQIQYLFQHRGLADQLRRANETRNSDVNVITDTTDGSEYKRVNVNREPFDLTLILSTDGAKIKRSSTADLWPVTFTVAEVRAPVRHLFITCVGIWYAKKKPDLNTLMRPFALELKTLSKKGGIVWKDPKSGEEFKSKVSAPVVVGDAPVRADALKNQNHNGKRGCITCEIKTQRVEKIEGERRKRVYKFSDEYQLRTKSRMLVFAEEAEESGRVIRGVKGRTVLSLLPGIDESTVVFAEYMHSVCLGLAKQVLVCWEGKSGLDCNLKIFVPALDDFVTALKPPSFFSRAPPRSVTDHVHWKAYEYLYWLLFYSVFVFIDLEEKFPTDQTVKKFKPYFDHWLLFVHSISLLMQAKITNADLDTAEILLKSFVKQFQDFYGEKELSYNLHQMLHLCLNCRRWGPMADISAFPFESFIGSLGKLVHGTRFVGKEIMKKFKVSQGVQALGNAIEMCTLGALEQQSNECLGNAVPTSQVNPDVLVFLNQTGVLSQENFDVFSRARINHSVYTSRLYQELATVDFCVRFKCVENPAVSVGVIEGFVKCQGNISIVVDKFAVNHEKLLVCHAENKNYVVKSFVPVKSNGRDLTLVNVENIESIEKVFLHKNFVCLIPKALRHKSVVM